MALPDATWTGQKIVTIVARFAGLANDASSREAVLDMINLGLDEIALQTSWDWNATTASDITVVSGTAEYNLPTGAGEVFDEIYDARLVGQNERTLNYITRRDLDKFVRGIQGNTGSSTHYYIYGPQKNAVVGLFPTPSFGDTLRLRYFVQQGFISDATASALAIPDKYMPLVIFKGAENTAAWKRPDQVGYWNGKFTAALSRAFHINRDKPDEVPNFSPGIEHSAPRRDAVNPNDLEYYPR